MKEFVSLMIQHQRRIHAYILYQVPNRGDADDVLQETLTEMFNKFETFQVGTNFLAWGLTIARYKILNFARSQRKQKMVFDSSLLDLLADEGQANIQTSSDEMDALKSCMQKLPSKDKKLIMLRYEAGQSFRRIAEQFDVSMQAIHGSISRIHVRLFKCIRLSLGSEAS